MTFQYVMYLQKQRKQTNKETIFSNKLAYMCVYMYIPEVWSVT